MTLQLSASKININIVPKSLSLRSNAPVPVLLQIFSDEVVPVTGKLEIQLFFRHTHYATITTRELTVIPGTQSRFMMLPPINFQAYNTMNIRFKMLFITDSLQYLIPTQQILFPLKDGVAFNILNSVDPFNRRKKTILPKALKFENLVENINNFAFTAHTGIINLSLEEFPKTIEEYCVYDIVLLNENVFMDMNEKEFSVLKNWVLAGGGLVLNLRDELLDFQHLEFLNDLIKFDSKDCSLLSFDKLGKLKQTDKKKSSMYHPAFGRFTLLRNKIKGEDYFQSIEWRLILTFMWRINSNRVESVVQDHKWAGKYFLEEENYSMYGFENEIRYDYRNHFYCSIKDVLNDNISLLLPKTTKMIPIWLLLIIMGSLIIIIGPIDYIVLGKLKCRRLTWIFFPIISIIFSVGIIFIANSYMGSIDHCSSVSVLDEGRNGNVYRTTQFMITFNGSSKETTYQNRGCFFSNQNDQWNLLKFSGSLFSNYNVSFKTKQWIPQISRINSYKISKNNHPEWSFPEIWNKKTQAKFLSQIFTNNGEFIEVTMLRRGKPLLLRKSQNKIFNRFLSQLRLYMNGFSEYARYTTSNSVYQYLFELSPTPNYGEENLMIGDHTNRDVKVVIVSLYDSNKRNIKIYRREYRGK